MTLFEVVVLAGDLTAIRVDCLREFAKLDPQLDTTDTSGHWLIKRANRLKGNLVSVAQTIQLKRKWKDWTWRDGVNISTVQGFLSCELVQNITWN